MKANAYVRIGRRGDTPVFSWEGDDTVAISAEFLADMASVGSQYMTYAEYPDMPGRRFTIGPYLLETLDLDMAQNVVYARRIFI